MKKHIANAITLCRILFSIIMLFFLLAELKYTLTVVCLVATVSAIQEGYFIGKGSLNK